MNLRDIAKSSAVMDGEVTLWMIPYLTLRNDIAISAFDKVVPRNTRWVHAESGQTRTTPPMAGEDGWDEVSDWGDIHNVFIVCEGVLVDAEVAANARPQARGFAAYWSRRGDDMQANWQLFTTLIGGKAYSAIWEAFIATRDTSYNAPEPLNLELKEDADPQPVGG